MKKIILLITANTFFCIVVFAQTLITPTYVDSVVMRDGKKLAVDIYNPDGGNGNTYPTILVQTPYNRLLYRTAGLPLFGNNISIAPYAMVIADWRCFYGSAAACAGNYDRAKDGYDLVEWIAQQSWSNGKVGTWGPSALGRIQYQTARKRPPHLICAVPLVAGPQYNYQEYFPGGVYRTEYVQTLDALGFGMSAILLAHPTYDMTWTYAEMMNFYPDSINVPMLMIGGWYDHNVDVMIEFFNAIRQSSFANVRDKHRLLMGPWTHGGHGNVGVGSAQQGELSYPNAAGWSDSLALMFFDYHLRSVPNNWNATPFIQYYQLGENTWNSTESWPPTGVSMHNLYLQADGTIKETLPTNAGDYLQFTYDPKNPSPTIGGATLHPSLNQGPYDQAPLVESRNDILVFTSPVLVSDVVMKGKPKVHLYISSDRKDTDFAVRLTDVYPDNRSMLVSEGIVRTRFRNGFTANDTAVMIPEQVYEVEINLPHTAITFQAGHKIRIDITSSNYPRFDCNLNNGKTMYTAGDTLIAINKVYTGSDRASYVMLPINGFFVDVDEITEENDILNIYPNPAGQNIYFSLKERKSDEADVLVYDISGRKLIENRIKLRESNNLDVSSLEAGMYFFTIKNDKRSFTKKIIIKK